MNKNKFELVSEKHRKHPAMKIKTPRRGTSKSAGYDFFAPIGFTVPSKSSKLVWTDIKCNTNEDEFLQIVVRSSIGIKKSLTMANTIGVIDSDYYNNPTNDGNIGICLYNYGDEDVVIEQNERICQGIFLKYGITVDDNCLEVRDGGIGSTGE